MTQRNACANQKPDADGSQETARARLTNRIGWGGTVAALLAFSAHAATMPSLVIPQGVGINIHFSRGHEKDLDLIVAAGVKVVRTDFVWDKTENYQGVYDWSAYDELADNLAKRGLRPLFLLAYSNALYENSTPKLWQGTWPYNELMSPQHPGSVAAFARWAAEAAKHFRKYNVIWEIWNEPNIQFWKPAPDVAAYSRLAIQTCNAIHEADANATVVAPASSKFPWEFLDSFFAAGALNCLDGISVHPYRSTTPETVDEDYARLRQLIVGHAPSHRTNIPILSGEWGYRTVRGGIPLQQQADFAVRMQLINLLHGIPLSIWYDWKNDGMDPNNVEHNYGVVDTDLEPKPAYEALKTMTTQLAGYQLVQRLDIGSSNDYALLFSNADGDSKLAVWTSGYTHDTRIAAPPATRLAKVTLTNWRGLSKQIAIDKNWIPVQLTQSPAYIAP